MTPRIVVVLAIAAIISVAAAAAVWQANHASAVTAGAGEPVIAGLVDKVNSVAEISVSEGAKALQLKRNADGWLVQPSGFPVKARNLQETLVGLARLTKLEQRTAKPDKLAILQLEEPGEEGGKSRRIVLKDESGLVLGDIVLGKAAKGMASEKSQAQYVRLGGDNQSWVALGAVTAGGEFKDWVDSSVVQINISEVKRVEFKHADGDSLAISKAGKTEQGLDKFVIEGLPAGVPVKDEQAVRYAATDIANIDFADVRKRSEGGVPAGSAELETDKGLKISYQLTGDGEDIWLRVSVADKGRDEAKAEEISSRVKDWEFKLAGYKLEQFRKRLPDFLNMQQ